MTKKLFRYIAFLEGVSYVLLLFFAVPIKYLLQNDFYVKLLGMPHGILFIIYLLFGLIYSFKKKLGGKHAALILTASIIPFGTFYIDRKYLQS